MIVRGRCRHLPVRLIEAEDFFLVVGPTEQGHIKGQGQQRGTSQFVRTSYGWG